MKIIEEVKNILKEEKYHQLATASKDGIPNICTIGALYIYDPETIIVIDNYMNKTMYNIKKNSKVAILVRKDKLAYQLKGTCKYVNEGSDYLEAKNWMKEKGEKYPAKGALIITVNEIYNSMIGDNAGEQII